MVKRSTTIRNRHRQIIARGRPPCALCGKDIEYDAHYLDPFSFTIDHVLAIADGGLDVLENCQPAHRLCNRSKSGGFQKPRPKPAPVRFVTRRSW